jgi:hypothetical protein
VITGVVCPGYVPGSICVHDAANNAGAGRIAAVLADIPRDDDAGSPPDFCEAIPGTPRCLAGQCTVCGPFAAGQSGCNWTIGDSGVVPTEDAGEAH